MLTAGAYLRMAVEYFYRSRKVQGAYADDCVRESWYCLICACAAGVVLPEGTSSETRNGGSNG